MLFLPLLFFAWGEIFISLPYDSSKNNESENPTYGFYVYNDAIPTEFVLFWKNWSKYIPLPWSLKWHRTSVLLKDGSWAHETKGNRQDFYKDEWKEKQYCFEYDYTDKYDGTVIPTKVYVGQRYM